jgi:hypothetical protein
LSGGTESGTGTTIAQGGAAFSTASFSLDGGRTLQLGGISTATGTFVQIELNGGSDPGSGILTIGSGATFNDQTSSSGLNIVTQNEGGTDTGTTAVMNNLGTFTKSGSAVTSTISTTFNNSGTVNVQSGTLNLSGGGTDSGIFNVSSGTLDITKAAAGTGVYTIGTATNGATLEFDSSVAAGATVMFQGSSGTLLILQPSSFSTSNVISGSWEPEMFWTFAAFPPAPILS